MPSVLERLAFTVHGVENLMAFRQVLQVVALVIGGGMS